MTVTTIYHNPPVTVTVPRETDPSVKFRSVWFDRDADLRRRQREHLDRVRPRHAMGSEADCMHNQCSNCLGTGVGQNGHPCIHSLSCPCPRCNSWS